MRNAESVLLLCITVLVVLFDGEPDIHDAIIGMLRDCSK